MLDCAPWIKCTVYHESHGQTIQQIMVLTLLSVSVSTFPSVYLLDYILCKSGTVKISVCVRIQIHKLLLWSILWSCSYSFQKKYPF